MARRLTAKDKARLAAVRATGLFQDLTEGRIAKLAAAGPGEDGDLVAAIVEDHARKTPRVLVLSAPNSAYRGDDALGERLAGVLRDDAERGTRYMYVGAKIYKPETHDQVAAVHDEALRTIGDERRFVALRVADFEEPLYVLCTPAQAKAMAEQDLEAFTTPELPAEISIATRVKALRRLLAKRKYTIRKDGTIALPLTLAAARSLVADVRRSRFHAARSTAWVERGLEEVP